MMKKLHLKFKLSIFGLLSLRDLFMLSRHINSWQHKIKFDDFIKCHGLHIARPCTVIPRKTTILFAKFVDHIPQELSGFCAVILLSLSDTIMTIKTSYSYASLQETLC